MTEVTCDYMVPLTVRVNVGTGEVLGVDLHLDGFQSSSPGWFHKIKGSLPPQEEGNHRVTLRQAFIEGHEWADGEHPLGDAALAIADRVTIAEPVALSWRAEPLPGGTIYCCGHSLDLTAPQSLDLQAAGLIAPHPGVGSDGIVEGDWILAGVVTWDQVYARLGGAS